MQRRNSLVIGVVAGGLLAVTLLAHAQATKPEYVVSVTTNSMVIPGLEEVAKQLGGNLPPELAGMFGSQRMLLLDLRSPGEAPKDASARHAIPEGLKLGKELPLEIIRPTKSSTGDAGGGSADTKLPDFTIKIYWGCGDEVKPGQPKVISTKDLQANLREALQRSQQMMKRAGRRGGVSFSDSDTHAVWPNSKDGKPVLISKDGSLVGDHTLTTNYVGGAAFKIERSLDFMDAVSFTSPRGDDGSDLGKPIPLVWKPIANATGYSLVAMASTDKGKTMVIWYSSSAYTEGGPPLDFTAPERVAALIRDGSVLAPDHTSCTIPKGIFKGAEAAMVNFIAYGGMKVAAAKGNEPPVRIQVKSTGMLMVGAPNF